MANTLVLQLDDADYNSFKHAADTEGTEIETWLLNTVRGALSDKPSEEKHEDVEDANGWPGGFFERTYGCLAEDPLKRLPQVEPETRELIR